MLDLSKPDESERLRKCCPACESVYISKRRKHGNFHCRHCGAQFISPSFKKCQTTKNIPKCLKDIIERKQEKKEN
jgi:ribosomal protein L37AE/L43A